MGTCCHSTEGTARGDVCPCPLGGTRGLGTSLVLWGKVVSGPNPAPCLEEVPGAFFLPQKLPCSPFTPHGYLSWPPLVSSGPPLTPHGCPFLLITTPHTPWPPHISSQPPLTPHGHPFLLTAAPHPSWLPLAPRSNPHLITTPHTSWQPLSLHSCPSDPTAILFSS